MSDLYWLIEGCQEYHHRLEDRGADVVLAAVKLSRLAESEAKLSKIAEAYDELQIAIEAYEKAKEMK